MSNLIDLMQFCSKETSRPYIMAPFSYGEHTFATDGRFLVRVDRRSDVPEGTMPTHESIKKLLASVDGAEFFKPPPASRIPPPDPAEECERCEGRGTEHDCPACSCKCAECNGVGKVSAVRSIALGRTSFNADYVAQILALPEVEIATKVTSRDGKGREVAFRFCGGVGILAALTDPYKGERHLGQLVEAREKASA